MIYKNIVIISKLLKKGDTVLFPFNNSDGTIGKLRPCVVLNNVLDLGEVEIAMISRTQRRGVARLIVNELIDLNSMGLVDESVIYLDKVNTVKDKFILKILGECTPNVMKRIDEGIVLKYKLPI